MSDSGRQPTDGPDWAKLEASADFQELVAARRRFVVPALAVFVVWFGGFLVLTAYARDFMTEKAIGNFTWAYVLAGSLIPMTWLIAFLYLRWSDRKLAPIAARIVKAAERGDP